MRRILSVLAGTMLVASGSLPSFAQEQFLPRGGFGNGRQGPVGIPVPTGGVGRQGNVGGAVPGGGGPGFAGGPRVNGGNFAGNRYRGGGYRGGYGGGYHRHGYGAAIGAGVAGLAAGALIGGAIANQGYGYGYGDNGYYDRGIGGPAYVAGDDVADAAPVVSDEEGVAYCQRRYKSYDVQSGTYLGYDGLRHPCP